MMMMLINPSFLPNFVTIDIIVFANSFIVKRRDVSVLIVSLVH